MKVNCQLKNTGNHKQKAELRKIFHFATAPLLSGGVGQHHEDQVQDDHADEDDGLLQPVFE